MKLLFDQNISFRILSDIKDIFPESEQVRNLRLENKTDREIWEYAKSNQCIIVTFDSDFYDFSLVWGHPPKVIWIRALNQTTDSVARLLRGHRDDILRFEKDDDLACLEIINNVP